MPIFDYPFVKIGGQPKPALAIQLINPANGFTYKTWALIDTGADTTVIPGYIAKKLYHDITHKSVKTAYYSGLGGPSKIYFHTFQLNVFRSSLRGKVPDEIAIKIRKRLYPVELKLHMMVLGESDFLKKYILTINYPKKVFSLRYPKKS